MANGILQISRIDWCLLWADSHEKIVDNQNDEEED